MQSEAVRPLPVMWQVDAESLPTVQQTLLGDAAMPLREGLTLYRELYGGGDGGAAHISPEHVLQMVQEGGAQSMSRWFRIHSLNDLITYTWEARNEVRMQPCGQTGACPMAEVAVTGCSSSPPFATTPPVNVSLSTD